MKRICTFFTLAAFLTAICFSTGLFSSKTIRANASEAPTVQMVDTGLNYVETLDRIDNPGRGFYQAISHVLNPTSTSIPSTASVNSLRNYLNLGHTIVHIAFGLEHFSDNAYYAQNASSAGTTAPITEQALSVVSGMLQNVRTSGQTCIIRFDYNRGGWLRSQVGNPEGIGTYINAEPDKQTMLDHINQLQPIFQEYVDVIQVVDVGMVGPWGEMHTTAAAKDPEIVNAIIDKFLEVVPSSRGISVRTPAHYRNWYNAKNGTEFTAATMQSIVIEEGSPESRVGMFNDGLLGSSTDIGTFSNPRVNEINWLKERTKFNFYGGEATYSGKIDTYGRNGYTDIEYFAYEGFLTHTTYLNSGWNGTVISGWMALPYDVKPLDNAGGQSAVLDVLYKEAEATAYKYISNRLGYRYVIRDMKAHPAKEVGGKLSFDGEIENVGFGNTINEKRTQIIFKNKENGNVYRQDLDISSSEWLSSTGAVPLSFDVDLKDGSSNYPAGSYDVFLKVNDMQEKEAFRDGALRSIRFSNEDMIFDEELGANRIASVSIASSLYTVRLVDDDSETVLYEFLYGGEGLDLTSYTVESKLRKGVYHHFDRWLGGYTQGMAITKNTTFTARYSIEDFPDEQEHTITLLDNDEDTVIQTITLLTGDLLDLNYVNVPDKILDKTKYKFSHWEGGYEDDLIIIRDWTFVASYIDVPLNSVTFNLDGGTLVEGTLVQLLEAGEDATPPTASRTGYAFKGWSSEGYNNVEADITITAVWVQVFTVTFELNGGKLSSGTLTQSIEKNSSATAPTLTREGYTFKGWDSDDYLDVTGDLTIKAIWEKKDDETSGGCFSGITASTCLPIILISLLFLVFNTRKSKKQA